MQTESRLRQSEPLTESPFLGMVWIPGGIFLMGSDKHYPEERPSHRVTVEGFWMDRDPVTNERFARFVQATHHVTCAEIPPDPSNYPGALEFELAADIVRSVIAPTWQEIGELGAIAVIRTFLNYFLEKDLEHADGRS
jgi:sulfatase modifying factor 1